MAEVRTGVYPGTFDPITNGHLDIIQRASKVVDRLVVGVAVNAGKGPLFGVEERVKMVEAEIAGLNADGPERVVVKSFENLLMDFAIENGARVIIRGLRAVSDFDYEFQMSSMNAKLNPDVETISLMASDKHQFIASRLVKEIAMLNGEISAFVPPRVAKRLIERCAER